MVKRLKIGESCGIVVDVQSFFLGQLATEQAAAISSRTVYAANLLRHLRVPTLFTLERPVVEKGSLPAGINQPVILEKNFFDLTKEKTIRDHLASLNRNQVILFGCETDVCILQSCLGLLELGYEVFVVEDLLFSSSTEVNPALQRMRDSGAVLLSYKTMFHELLEAVEGSEHRLQIEAKFGKMNFPDS